MDSAFVLAIAKSLREALLPACDEIVICGSLRRGCRDAGDVDFVCLPKRDPDLWGFGTGECTALNDALQQMVAAGALALLPKAKGGERLKTYMIPALGLMSLELFVTTPHNHGYIVAIRTGPSEFSKSLVTPTIRGGLLPPCLACLKGNVYAYPSFREAEGARQAEQPRQGRLVSVPNEAAFFALLGLRVLPPELRASEGAQRVERLPVGAGFSPGREMSRR